MDENKKVVLIGPPGAGKTTIKEVLLEKENPLFLLKNPLEPSRGLTSKVYSIFKTKVGIFDLAGQENEIWLSDRSSGVFKKSDLIICIFDISTSLEYITSFLLDIDRIKREILSVSCEIIVFLHKIDLFNNSYVNHKLKVINDFFTIQHSMGIGFKVYATSITEDFFFDTYFIITQILNRVCRDTFVPVNSTEFLNLKTEVKILLSFDALKEYHKNDLHTKLKLTSNEISHHLDRLENLAFLKTYENSAYFQLTERAQFLKKGIEKNISTIKKNRSNPCIELLYTFQNVMSIEV